MNESNDDKQSEAEPDVVLETIDLARDFGGRIALNDVSLTELEKLRQRPLPRFE